MRVCEGWVDLDGSGVALQSALHISHFLESIAHVGIGICEGWLNSAKKKNQTS
jgi:hypothetical protein